MIRDAMESGMEGVDRCVLIGAAARGCEATIKQWVLGMSHFPSWRKEMSVILPGMALRAIGERERPEALEVLRWVFNTATSKGAEVQLPPVLLTLLAFTCARYGHFDTFCWLYTEGRMLAEQDIAIKLSAADVHAFKEEVFVPLGGAMQGELSFIRFLRGESTSATLMDTAIGFAQQEFVVALSRFDVAPELSSFTSHSWCFAAQYASLGLLQWLHAQPACPFDGTLKMISASVRKRDSLPPGAGDNAFKHSATEQLVWLRSIGAFQTLTQQDLDSLMGCAAARYAYDPIARLAHQARLQWLQDEMGADWLRGGAAYISQKAENLDARGVVRMVSDLACPWGPWTSTECALVRSRLQQRASVLPRSVRHWMQQLHALGCPCTCARAEDA
eukprot:TRINITY_DN5514_c0_g2_i1.p1 TRINITY_DN5514_c0_g2~~TRINITY_DN5514_c0_g2_i1.p1  ORF type:complete len:389 (-),score=83.28 TRINITY_DN5514_c0_g2_i1:275-1441(-)